MIDAPPEPPPSYEQVFEHQLVECGLDANGISVRYEDDLQSIEIVIRPSAGATASHFECIKKATGYEIVTFEDREMYAAYMQYTSELARPEMLEDLEGRLREKGLLEGFPERQNYETLADYAMALEKHGGVLPGSALRIAGDTIYFDPPRDGQRPPHFAEFSERYSDLLDVILFASVRDRLNFGFIGNEAFVEEE